MLCLSCNARQRRFIILYFELYCRGGGGGGVETMYVPIITEGSGTPTTRPRTGNPVQGLGAGGKVGCY